MRKYYFFIVSIFLIFVLGCNNDPFETVKSSGNLQFSKDTIFLDTIFSNISSITRTLKIYNRSNNNITIPNIKLGRGDNSFYRLNVDGISGKSYQNIDILARDSIFIFIEATIDFSQVTNPIYTDSIVFDQGANKQDVKLVTLVQDAHFLFPKRDADGVKETIVLGTNSDGDKIEVEGFYLDGDAIWENDKPYVIYGYVGVKPNNTLNIKKGVQVHFHKNSGLLIEKDASLKVNGTLDENVVFEGDRLEPSLSETAGQWGTIWLRAGSKNHEINHAIIKNNTIGILMDSIGDLINPTLKIRNTQIYNTASFGILGRTANIWGENLVIANNAQSSLACTIGGTYNFTHCTFVNYWNNSIREFPTVLVNNYLQFSNPDGSESILARDIIAANFTNNIIDGDQNIEYILDKNDGAELFFNFKNNLLKFDDVNNKFTNDPLYDFENANLYQNNILNGVPNYKDIETNQYIIGEKSDANGKADIQTSQQIPFDLIGINRLPDPDIGAYQHIIFEEN